MRLRKLDLSSKIGRKIWKWVTKTWLSSLIAASRTTARQNSNPSSASTHSQRRLTLKPILSSTRWPSPTTLMMQWSKIKCRPRSCQSTRRSVSRWTLSFEGLRMISHRQGPWLIVSVWITMGASQVSHSQCPRPKSHYWSRPFLMRC